jgi:hypothetical protein
MISTIIAGDSIRYVQKYVDYTPTIFSASLFINASTTISVQGIPSVSSDSDYMQDAFVFYVAANQTQVLSGGLYSYTVRVNDAVTTKTVESNNITIAPNPAFVKNREQICTRMIDLIEKAMINQLSTGEAAESISIAGRSISLMSRAELLSERSFWDRERKALLKSRTGQSGIKQIRVII